MRALRAPAVRGRWGETTLRRVAELAGMIAQCDFVEQAVAGQGDGNFRPDMVVRLPAGRQVVVDAKTDRDRRHFVTCVFELALVNPVAGRPEVSSETDPAVRAVRWVAFEEAAALLVRPSLGEPLLNYLYYGKEKLPRRYWAYPEYNTLDFKPVSWPPTLT